MTVETASSMVLKEIARYVAAHKKPDRRPDQTHQDLQARLAQNPCDQAALKQWAEHMQRKRHTEVMKKLRHFRKSAIGSTGTFFADLATWLVRPAHVSSMSPTLASATKRLPDFAGDPHWDPEKAFKGLPSLRMPDTPVSQTLPTWREFRDAAYQPKKKAMGMDAVPPHTIQWLPQNVQWILYRRVCEVWHQGQMPTEWTDTRISLLYKKGDPRDASNYRPIAVSTCMYQITTKLILRRIKTPLTEVLSDHQAGGRRGHTTLSQAIKLWSSALSMPGTPDVVLLDIAKAYPSTPPPTIVGCNAAGGGTGSLHLHDAIRIPRDAVLLSSRWRNTLIPSEERGEGGVPPLPPTLLRGVRDVSRNAGRRIPLRPLLYKHG